MDGADYKTCVLIHHDSPSETIVRNVLAEYKNAGINFVRDGGDRYGVCTLAKRLAPEYGIDYITPVFAIHKKDNYGSVVGLPFSDMDEYASLVHKADREGADFIKIMLSGIVDFDHYGVITKGAYTKEEVCEMVNIAHSEGLSVMAHVNGVPNVKLAIEAGVDTIEHGYFIDDETIDMLALTETIWVPTLVTSKNLLRYDRNNRSTVKKIVAMHSENIKKAYQKGALIGLGSDAGAYGVFHAQGALDEYEALNSAVEDAGLDKMLTYTRDLVKRKFRRLH